MGKFDKAMGVMDDEMLDEVSGGAIITDIESLSVSQLQDKHESFMVTYRTCIDLGWDKSANPSLLWQYNDCCDSLQRIEDELDRKGGSYVSYKLYKKA